MTAVPAIVSQTLPGLVQRAAAQLASATNAAEVLDARDTARVAYDAAKSAARFAKAKGAHDELIAKAHRAQADALEIEAMAKRRLADEYDAAQLRGEVRTQADNNAFSKAEKAGFADIGLTGKDIHEARQIRDAEETYPGIVKRTLDAALDAGEEPTRAAVRRATSNTHRNLSDTGKQLQRLRQAWREACPTVREHFLIEVSERIAA
jgi:hypothetical protein